MVYGRTLWWIFPSFLFGFFSETCEVLHHVRACWSPQSWFGYIRQCRSVVMPLPTDHDIPGSNPVLGLTKNKLIMKQIRWMHLQQKMPKRWELRHPKFGFYIKFWWKIAMFQLRYIFVRVGCWNHLFCLDYMSKGDSRLISVIDE